MCLVIIKINVYGEELGGGDGDVYGGGGVDFYFNYVCIEESLEGKGLF